MTDNSKIRDEFKQNKLSNSSSILELSVKFASQICHENINKPLDGDYFADFGIDNRKNQSKTCKRTVKGGEKYVNTSANDYHNN